MGTTPKKIVMVTGATSGIGAATARRFAQDDCALIILGRRADRLRALAAEVEVPVHCLAVDVTDAGAVADAIGGLPAAFLAVDVLVNNAGLARGLAAAQDASLQDWDEMIETNVKGSAYCTHAVLPGMVARNRGHIINVGSVAGSYPYPGGNVYGATKAFVHQFTLNLKADLLRTRVRTTCLEPGLTETEFSQVRFRGDHEKAARTYAGAESMTPEDMAEVIFAVNALPERVNVNRIEVMPVCQGFSPFAIERTSR